VSVIGLELQAGNTVFPTKFSHDRIMTISPSFSAVANAIGLAQLQTFFESTMNFQRGISNLQFTYPSNSPPATVDISTPSDPFFIEFLPAENSNAQFSVNVIFELLVQVSAFSDFVELTVTYDFGYDQDMQATPAASGGNNEDVCIEIINTFSIAVANSGQFFQALGQASSQTILQEGNSVLNECQTVALGPSPPSSRRVRSSLHSRDSFTCPPAAAVPADSIAFDGSFP